MEVTVQMKRVITCLLKQANWYNLQNLESILKFFGVNRKIPIDKIYIERFIESNKNIFKGLYVNCKLLRFQKVWDKYKSLLYINDNLSKSSNKAKNLYLK
jgi:hypothetical protein